MVRVGRAAAALARVIDLPARGPACLSEIFEKPQVERVLLARPERSLLKLFGWLFVVWLFVWLLVFWRLLSSAGGRALTDPPIPDVRRPEISACRAGTPPLRAKNARRGRR
jgi:hypothetical protein